MEKAYQCMLEGEAPNAADLMFIFGIFTGAALNWTPSLLEKLATTKSGAKAAFTAYARTALMIMEDPKHINQSSTTALVGMGILGHVLMNTDGFPVKVHLIRHRCLLMARDMQIHRLDTAKAREERRIKGCDMIEIEIQRRAWWSMVASDWYVIIFYLSVSVHWDPTNSSKAPSILRRPPRRCLHFPVETYECEST